jgi:predicted ATP-grasp superfamily ATP-dependent carboligase
MKKVLVINDRSYIVIDLIDLFYRAGYQIDVISANKAVGLLSEKLNRLIIEKNKLRALEHAKDLIENNNYEVIVPCSDGVLQTILDSDLNEAMKLSLLPVISVSDFSCLCSRIKLSYMFESNNVQTPKFYVCNDKNDLIKIYQSMTKPFMLKVDKSNLRKGVFEIKDEDDLYRFININDHFPVLIQEKVIGKELDVSGYFINKKLVYLYIAEPLKNIYPNGPSAVRKYFPSSYYSKEVIEELNKIGNALGLNGFSNISCIETKTNGRYYFEVDLRPNAWINHGQYFGHDLAEYLREDRFYKHPTLNNEIVLAHYLRVGILDLILNRHRVLSQIPANHWKVLLYKTLKDSMKKYRNHVKHLSKRFRGIRSSI